VSIHRQSLLKIPNFFRNFGPPFPEKKVEIDSPIETKPPDRTKISDYVEVPKNDSERLTHTGIDRPAMDGNTLSGNPTHIVPNNAE